MEAHAVSFDLLGEGQVGVFDGGHQVHGFRFVAGRAQRHQQVTYPARHTVDLADDIGDVLLRSSVGGFLGQLGA